MAKRQAAALTPVGDRGHAVTQSGERVIGRFTPTGKDAKTEYRGTPASGVGPRAAKSRRTAWEGTPEGQARTAQPLERPGYSHFMRTYDHKLTGPAHYDTQLPGMADPNAAPRPPRWHELSGEQQRAAQAGARAHGTSLDQMKNDIGTHLDQAVVTAASYGHARGHSEDFYSTGAPRQVLDRSAHELGISPTIHAQMNAMTSPQAKFSQLDRSTGEVRYPNNEAAVHAVSHVQRNKTHKGITNNLEQTGTGQGAVQGYMTNIVKAAKSFDQHERGKAPGDWITNKAGNAGPFENSPKTGPYANSWSDSHPQFTVSDLHTGGGGFLPHLGSEKAAQVDSMGKPKMDDLGNVRRDKSEREDAIASIPHFHSMADEAMRGAMHERNMPSVRDAQALQWGQEQIDRGLVEPHEAYRKPSRMQQRGQGGEEQLHFDGMSHYTDSGPSRKALKKQTPGQESLFG